VKRPFLVVLALAASAGFAIWLVRTPHELREILLACTAWVLGFWVAAAIQSRGPRRKSARSADDAVEDEHAEDREDEADEADWEDGDWEDDR
jgi:hypothetical protein